MNQSGLPTPPIKPPPTCGLLLVDKPLGWSSMTVVRRVRRAAGGVKTGHAGTLDPLATGLVICCLGPATRTVPGLMGLTKVYETQIDLSAFTSTDDREGERREVAVAAPPDLTRLRAALEGFLGEIDQVPPNFSAIHVKGRRAYKMARRGESFTIAARKVRIDAIDLLDYAWPIIGLRITCGKGAATIRSLAPGFWYGVESRQARRTWRRRPAAGSALSCGSRGDGRALNAGDYARRFAAAAVNPTSDSSPEG